METEDNGVIDAALTSTNGIAGAQERAARAYHLLQQGPLTTRQMAERLGMTYQGAWYLLWKVSRAVPIYYSEDTGEWQALDEKSG